MVSNQLLKFLLTATGFDKIIGSVDVLIVWPGTGAPNEDIVQNHLT